MSALEELEDKISEIVGLMPDKFDSHQFILKLGQTHQQLYVLALNEYANNDQPFQTVHAVIVKKLKKRDDLVNHIDNKTSKDIFGNPNETAFWQKV